MKPFAVGGATEFSCGAHSNNNINYSVPITLSTHMNFSPQKRLISTSSDLVSSKYLSLHTDHFSRVKGSIDNLFCWLAFGAYGFFPLERNTRPSTLINVIFALWASRKPFFKVSHLVFTWQWPAIHTFGEKRSTPSFPQPELRLFRNEKTTYVLFHISK